MWEEIAVQGLTLLVPAVLGFLGGWWVGTGVSGKAQAWSAFQHWHNALAGHLDNALAGRVEPPDHLLRAQLEPLTEKLASRLRKAPHRDWVVSVSERIVDVRNLAHKARDRVDRFREQRRNWPGPELRTRPRLSLLEPLEQLGQSLLDAHAMVERWESSSLSFSKDIEFGFGSCIEWFNRGYLRGDRGVPSVRLSRDSRWQHHLERARSELLRIGHAYNESLARWERDEIDGKAQPELLARTREVRQKFFEEIAAAHEARGVTE